MQSIDTLLRELQLSSPAMTSNLWMQTGRFKKIKQVLNEVETWPRVVIRSEHRGLQFTDGNRVFGRLQWNGRLEVIFPPQVRDRLIAEEMAVAEPDQSWSDRVVWMVRNAADVDRAVWLLRLSYLRFFADPNSQTFPTNLQHGGAL
jgi:hypothetical protein